MGNEEGYVICRMNKDATVDIFKYIYPNLKQANEVTMKDAKATGTDIFNYDVSKVLIENKQVMCGKNELKDINIYIKPICSAINELEGCYVFSAKFDIDLWEFDVCFECDCQKSLSIIKKALSGEYEPLYYEYNLSVEDFSDIKTQPIYYKLSIAKEPLRFNDFIEDMNSIIGEIRRWSSPAYDNYFNRKM